jgi:membrane fusion protein (multidrug efflux system)
MPASFARTLTALRGDRRGGPVAALLIALGILSAWAGWAVFARVSVYRTSTSARIEVQPAPTRVASPVEGRVVTAQLEVGARVASGDILIELDATSERIAADRARARVAALLPEVESIEKELAAEDDAHRYGSTAELDLERESVARLHAAEAALASAEHELAREVELARSGASPQADRDKAEATVKERRGAVDAIRHELAALGASHLAAGDTRRARHEQLSRQRAELMNEVAAQKAEVDRLVHEVERRTVRAPLAGTLGEIALVRPGAVVHAGDVIATVVPEGHLHVVAEYDAVALGRLAPGQSARIRLDGFPSTRYGTLGAQVMRVGSELREGAIRVELDLVERSSSVPVQHGMTCVVDIEIERTSPAALLLRIAGEGLDRSGKP